MAEVSEDPLEGANKTKEAPVITLTETVTGIALKTFVPSAVHGREELDKYRSYKFLHSAGSAAELVGIGMTATGKELGPAMFVAGKLTAWIAEERAFTKEARRVKKARRLEKRGKISQKEIPPMPVGGIEGEPEIIKLPSKMVGVAAKVLLPSFLSAGQIEKKGYRLVVQSAKAVEILGPAAGIVMGDPELGGGAYVVAKSFALFAEAADRALPRAKERLKVLKEKGWVFKVGGMLKTGIGSASGGVVRGVGRVGVAGGGVIRKATAGAGLRVREAGRVFGEKAEPFARKASVATGRKLKQTGEYARQKLSNLIQKEKEPANFSRSQRRRWARNRKRNK